MAFPAPDRAAVNAFFSAALKAGGKMHNDGAPRLRDADQGYFSAAVVDFDGNSVEAVHRSAAAGTAAAAAASSSERALTVVERSSSKASRSVVTRERVLPPTSEGGSVNRTASRAPPPPSNQVGAKEETGPSGKTVVGTLIGAAAGAAVAYAMCKGDSESAPTPSDHHPTQQRPESTSTRAPSMSPAQQTLLPPEYKRQTKAIEAPPPSTPDGTGMSDYARTALSKNPTASTIFDGLDRCSRVLGSGGSVRSRRHSMTGGSSIDVVSDTNQDPDLPIRAIEGVPPDYYCNDNNNSSEYSRPRSVVVDRGGGDHSDAISLRSSSTIKPRKTGSKTTSKVSTSSSRRSGHSRSVRAVDDIGVGLGSSSSRSKKNNTSDRAMTPTPSPSSVHSAAKIPLPTSSVGTRSVRGSNSHSHASTSFRSARDVPLPASEISGAKSGIASAREGKGSKASVSSSTTRKDNKKEKKPLSSSMVSKFDSGEPVRPSDSASQMSSSVASGRSRSRR